MQDVEQKAMEAEVSLMKAAAEALLVQVEMELRLLLVCTGEPQVALLLP
jgi:hypothetical protein